MEIQRLFRCLVAISLMALVTRETAKANELTSNEIPNADNQGRGNKVQIAATTVAATTKGASEASAGVNSSTTTTTNSSGGGSSMEGGQEAPPTNSDISVVADAIINSLVQNKAILITYLVNFINWLFGGLLSDLRDFVNRFMGRPVQPQRPLFPQPMKGPPKPIQPQLGKPGSLAERRSDNIAFPPNEEQQQDQPPQHQQQATSKGSTTVSGTNVPDPLFVMPLLDRPITYEDIQMMQRLVFDSVDIYRAWQTPAAMASSAAAAAAAAAAA